MPFIPKEKIKIAIDGGDYLPFESVNSGIQRVVASFLMNIPQNKKYYLEFNYYYFGKTVKKKQIKKINYEINIKKLPKHLYSSLFLPLFTIKNSNRIFIGFSGFSSPLFGYFNVKSVVFIYDLGFIKYPNLYTNYSKILNNIKNSIEMSDEIVTLTSYSQRQVELFVKQIDPQRKNVKTIYAGMDHLLLVNNIKVPLSNYFLYIGVVKPIKNIHTLIEIFVEYKKLCKEMNRKLVIIGRKEKQYYETILNSKTYKDMNDQIIFLENLSDEQVVSYIRNCIAVLNISLEEGFCFPVLEALSLGKRTIVNNLNIYYEFSPSFKNLVITANNNEFIKAMLKIDNKTEQLVSRKIFLWKNFSKELLKMSLRLIDTA
jgi:glycosyltransferase involved in cell wall biosynthesis